MYASATSMIPNITRGTAIMPQTSSPSDSLSFRTSSEFEIEKSPLVYSPSSGSSRRKVAPTMPMPQIDNDFTYRTAVSDMLVAMSRLSTISGLISMDSTQLVLFFRTQSAITHTLEFPIDVNFNTPPALDVLITSCRPHQTSDFDYSEHESLFYPPNLPLTTSLEIANLPILDGIRNTLFPLLPQGHYLTVTRDKLEVVIKGSRMGPQPLTLRNDGRVATIAVTLPSRFHGGKFIIRDAEGHEEEYFGRNGKDGDLEWVAFTADCDYQVETVTKGCRLTVFYGVYLKTFGPTGVTEPLINPSDKFLDLLSRVLNSNPGQRIGIYLTNTYGVNPSEVLAETLVPMLKGGDNVVYHAIKLYNIVPELHWTAGGYIWPVDRTVEIAEQGPNGSPNSHLVGLDHSPRRGAGPPAVRGVFGAYNASARAGSISSGYSVSARGGSNTGAYPEFDESITDNLRFRVQQSGAIPLAGADIVILSDWNNPSPLSGIGKERVPFVVGGELDKLVVNTLIVIRP